MGNDQMHLRQRLYDMIQHPNVQLEYINVVKRLHWMNFDIFTVLRGPELTAGQPFQGLTNVAPPPRKMGNDQMRLRQQL
jgi:hypothetical protein